MNRPTIVAALLAGCSIGGRAQQPAAPAITRFVASGIPVVFKRVTANDVVAVQLYLRGGSAVLNRANAGIERFIGDAMTHGTAKYSRDQFTGAATATGTNVSASAGYDFTVFSLLGVRQHWDAAWDLFAQAVVHPTFPAEELEQVRGQIVNELRQHEENPDLRLSELADSALYIGHPYAIDPQGTVQSIQKLSRQQLVAWHRRRLAKSDLLLVVVGNVSRQDLVAKIASAFGTLPAGTAAPAVPSRLGVSSPDLVVVKQELPTNYVMGVFRAPAPSHPDFPAMRVAVRVLSDRLFEEVRTKRNLTYAVSAGLSSRAANLGSLYVTAVNPDTTVKVMLSEVRRLQQQAVPAQLLRETINVFATQYFMGQQTNMGQASQLGLWELLGGGWPNAVHYVDRLRAVTPQDVRRVAGTYLHNFRFAVIGDPSKIQRSAFIF